MGIKGGKVQKGTRGEKEIREQNRCLSDQKKNHGRSQRRSKRGPDTARGDEKRV